MKIKSNTPISNAILLSVLFIQTATQNVQAQPMVEKGTLVNFKTQSGLYRYKLGNFEITSISDGTVPQDLHALLKGGSKSDIDHLLKNAHLANPVEASINSFLINTGKKL